MTEKSCPDCSALVTDADRFCGQCGARLADPDTAPAAPDDAATDGSDWTRLVDMPQDGTDPPMTVPPPVSEFAEMAAAAEPDSVADDAIMAADMPPPARRWLGPALFALAALVVVGGVWWTSADRHPMAELAPEDEPTAADERAAWQAAYRDEFVSGPVTMLVNTTARKRDFPSDTYSSEQGVLEEATELTGRWVRGHGGLNKWLRLSDGGYVSETSLIAPDAVGAPIAITFSNRDSGFGPAIRAYLDQASARARARFAQVDALPEPQRSKALAQLDETTSTYVRVPNRRFHGLTVTAVAVHYEASGIIFREPVATVMRVFRERGIAMDAEGYVALSPDAVESCSFTSTAQWPQTAEYGASELNCGV